MLVTFQTAKPWPHYVYIIKAEENEKQKAEKKETRVTEEGKKSTHVLLVQNFPFWA